MQLQAALDKLADGVEIEGVRYKGVKARLDKGQGDNQWITLSLTEGKNREVRKLMDHLGLKVNRLIRTAYGPFQLGKLERGAIEEVPSKQLVEQIGVKLSRELGL